MSTTSLSDYTNSEYIKGIRSKLLAGEKLDICKSCRYEDMHGKISGRQRQLLKSGINLKHFEKTLCSSPHWDMFKQSADTQGYTDQNPIDLQIDVGNTCNSACIMCSPMHSSRLGQDFKKLIKIEPTIFEKHEKYINWTDNDQLVEKFIKELSEIPNIRYIHFLGGETLYLKSFYTICNRLIELDLAKTISIGTTTNATVYNEELVHIIKNFKHVHLGISIETYTALNDYIRWPSEIGQIGDNINKLMNLREESNLQMSLRITPNIFTVYHLDSMFEFMINNKIIAESCNILSNPSHLRMELLPDDLRQLALEKIQNVIDRHGLEDSDQIIINRRREDLVDPVISSVIFEYKKFLKTYIVPDDVDEERYNLVKFIKAFESIRHNTILDHLPEYEKFLRRYGY